MFPWCFEKHKSSTCHMINESKKYFKLSRGLQISALKITDFCIEIFLWGNVETVSRCVTRCLERSVPLPQGACGSSPEESCRKSF